MPNQSRNSKRKPRTDRTENENKNPTQDRHQIETTKDEVCKCAKCNKDIYENDKALACDCNENTWYHIECIYVSEDQYNIIMHDENFDMNWVCSKCKQLTTRPLKESQSKQYDEIIKLLLEDIGDLKAQINLQKVENDRLSETLAKKMEVIYRLENIICNIASAETDTRRTENSPIDSVDPEHAGPNGGLHPENQQGKLEQGSKERRDVDATEERKKNEIMKLTDNPRHNKNTNIPLIIGDSLIKDIPKIINTAGQTQAEIKVAPGARIQDVSKFISNQKDLPDNVILHVGSNNISSSKTPNHVMRPLWLTIEAYQKKFPHTTWHVSSIPLREDCSERFMDETNKALKFMCAQLKVNFLDNNIKLNKNHLSWDGIHLNHEGSRVLASQLQNILDDIIRPTIENQLSPNFDPILKSQTR